MGGGSGCEGSAGVGDKEYRAIVLDSDRGGSDGGVGGGGSAGEGVEVELMGERLVLKKDFVIPAGTIFTLGPTKTTYSGGNFVADIAISDDETMQVVVFNDPDTLEMFDHEGEG